MLYSNADLKNWLPSLADTPIGFAGMFYLGVDDFDGSHDRISRHAEIIKDTDTDHTGQRMFYFRDPDGYVIGINDQAALQAGELGKYARPGLRTGLRPVQGPVHRRHHLRVRALRARLHRPGRLRTPPAGVRRCRSRPEVHHQADHRRRRRHRRRVRLRGNQLRGTPGPASSGGARHRPLLLGPAAARRPDRLADRLPRRTVTASRRRRNGSGCPPARSPGRSARPVAKRPRCFTSYR